MGSHAVDSKLPLNTRVVYRIAAKHERCMVTRLKYATSTAQCDIKSNLDLGQRVSLLFTHIFFNSVDNAVTTKNNFGI